MNTQLVDSIIQAIASLSPAERELVKQKLFALDGNNRTENTGSLTLDERKAFLRKPLAERRAILALQEEVMATHYQDSNEWRESMAGDIFFTVI
jgi:hypothetical protein